jgi:hypothetical protein
MSRDESLEAEEELEEGVVWLLELPLVLAGSGEDCWLGLLSRELLN